MRQVEPWQHNLDQLQATIDLQVRYKMLPASFNARDVIFPAALRT